MAGGGAGDWTPDENRSIVEDYFAMLLDERAGRPYVKSAHNRALRERMGTGRSEGSVEFKHANISAVLTELGLPPITGYKPRGNYQEALRLEIQRLLEADPRLFGTLRRPAGGPAPASLLEPADVPAVEPRKARGRHVDYGLLQEESQHRGRLGEKFVFEYEKFFLAGAGRVDLAESVRWVARDDGDGLGYDIRSCNIEGEARYIEVKATAYGAQTPFYMTSAELDFALRHQQSYCLYRVYDVLDAPQFYVLSGNIAERTEKVPVMYRVSPILPD